MELRKTKYKQTELGLIPKDWGISNLGDLSLRIGDGIHSTPKYSESGEYYFVNGNNLINGKVTITENTKKVSQEEFKIHKRELNNFTILISINGTIGNLAFYNNEKIILGKSAAYINLSNKIEKYFLFQLLQTELIEKYFDNELTGSTIRNLGVNSIRNTPIPIPPLPEQKAIAQVLSDTDTLIQTLEQKLAKKRAIKQGAMQQLLTPKEDWEVKRIGDLCDILDNLRVPLNGEQRLKMKGDIPYCGANGIVDYVNDYVIDDEIILMAEDGGYFDEYKTRPIAYLMKGKSWVNNHAHILKAKSQYFQDFIYYSVVHKNILDYINGGTRAKLNKGDLVSIEIDIPNSKQEQTRIATILSDMDTEIEQIEQKLAKYKLLKQGLMQQLLKGKIRLV